MKRSRARAAVVAVLAVALALISAACSTAHGAAPLDGRVIQVVAAENFWGSIAQQVGGRHVRVISIITNPNTDPHSYEPAASDGKTIASAQLVIENGIGYDPWIARLLTADGAPTVLNVGSVVGVADGGNPHRWYNPADVRAVIDRLVSDYSKLDPAAKVYFARHGAAFEQIGLRRYHELIADIRRKYGGTPGRPARATLAVPAPAPRPRPGTPSPFTQPD